MGSQKPIAPAEYHVVSDNHGWVLRASESSGVSASAPRRDNAPLRVAKTLRLRVAANLATSLHQDDTIPPRMQKLAIQPLGPVDAVVTVPGSKSLTNRALLVAALAEGDSTLTGCLFSDDTQYMLARSSRSA